MDNISIATWIVMFLQGAFNRPDRKTQCNAGWYDWFCKDALLRDKTYKMGDIIKDIKPGGKVDLKHWYVWFKNNCPGVGALYDDFRFADRKTGNVQFTIHINCNWDNKRYAVYGRKPNGKGRGRKKGYWDHPMFETNSVEELKRWLNTPWEKEET